MSEFASISFPFDGAREEFTRIYNALCDLDLDIGAYFHGKTGTIEFMMTTSVPLRGALRNGQQRSESPLVWSIT
jgi:hypothetical protein